MENLKGGRGFLADAIFDMEGQRVQLRVTLDKVAPPDWRHFGDDTRKRV